MSCLLRVSKLKLYLSRKSLLTSLCQREELVPPLWKRGARGDLLNVNPISRLLLTLRNQEFVLLLKISSSSKTEYTGG
jgi:hypothetical protein